VYESGLLVNLSPFAPYVSLRTLHCPDLHLNLGKRNGLTMEIECITN